MKRDIHNFEARITRSPKKSKSGHERFGYAALIHESGRTGEFRMWSEVVQCDHAHKTESAARQCGEKLLVTATAQQMIENLGARP